MFAAEGSHPASGGSLLELLPYLKPGWENVDVGANTASTFTKAIASLFDFVGSVLQGQLLPLLTGYKSAIAADSQVGPGIVVPVTVPSGVHLRPCACLHGLAAALRVLC